MLKKKDHYSFIYYATLIASIGGFLVGYSLVMLSAVMPFVDKIYHFTLIDFEFIYGTVLASAVFGSLISGLLSNIWGRKTTILVSSVAFAVASALALLGDQYALLFASRAATGLGIGLAMTSVPFYICELVPTNIRGSCICVFIVEYYLGYFLAYLIGRYIAIHLGWKLALMTPIIPALLLFLGMRKMPESPFWLFSRGKVDRAVDALKAVRRVLDIDYEVGLLQTSSELNKKIRHHLFDKRLLKVILIGLSLALLLEITGAHTVFYYLPTLLNYSGLWSTRQSLSSFLWMGFFSFAAATVAMLLIDRLGRRKLMIYGSALMTLASLLIAITLMYPIQISFNYSLITFLFCLFVFGFVLGIGTVSWLMICEIFPQQFRSLLISLVLSVKWGASLLINIFFLNQYTLFGNHTSLWFFAFMGVLSIFLAYRMLPETSQMSLFSLEESIIGKDDHDIQFIE